MVGNKGIHVIWASYAYLAYKKQRHLESSRKTQQENLVQLQEHSFHAQQSLLLVASSLGLLNNFVVTTFSHDVLPSNIPNLNSGATTPSGISSLLHVLRPPSSLVLSCQLTTWAMNMKVEGSTSKIVATKIAPLQALLQPIVTKDVIKSVHNLLFAKQQIFLGLKQCIQELVAEKSQKELEHWSIQLMFDD
jgi:hypothetical protein